MEVCQKWRSVSLVQSLSGGQFKSAGLFLWCKVEVQVSSKVENRSKVEVSSEVEVSPKVEVSSNVEDCFAGGVGEALDHLRDLPRLDVRFLGLPV